MILEAATAAYLVWDWYHRQGVDDGPEVKQPPRLEIPRTDNGAPIGLIYGRTRIREPVVAWAISDYSTDVYGGASNSYQLKAFITLGIPFESGENVTHNMWVGDEKLQWGLLGGALGTTQTGDGEFETAIAVESSNLGGYVVHGTVETLNGKATQVIVDDDAVAHTAIGAELLTHFPSAGDIQAWIAISSYRGVMSAYIKKDSSTGFGFAIGPSASIPAMSFESSTYKSYSWLSNITHRKIDDDAQPMCVLYSLLTDKLGKAAIPTTKIHEPSWRACAATLYAERHGYSNYLSPTRPLRDHVKDVLAQIDGLIYLDPSDGLFHARLIRADYALGSLPLLNRDNCTGLSGFAVGSMRGLINRVRVIYSARNRDYNQRDVVAGNSQDPHAVESTLEFPGITTPELAQIVADRELNWRCRPGIKCRAIGDRSWWNTKPGSCLRMQWTSPDVANLVMRVVHVDKGTLSDGAIAMDLILDNSYVAPRAANADPSSPPRIGDERRWDP